MFAGMEYSREGSKNMRRYSRTIRTAAAVAALIAISVPAWAHLGRRVHRHPHRRSTVIVVGKPRPVRHTVVIAGRPSGTLDMNVKPKATEVWIDGKMRGTADDFDGHPQKLHLAAGPHRLKLITPDGEVYRRDIHVTAGTEVDIDLKFED